MIDPDRNVVIWSWYIQGEPFGDSQPNQDPDGDGKPFTLDLRFPGQRYDSATGLYQNDQRDYDPKTGRYLQSDPIGLEGGIDPFAYVGNNPLMYVDLFGLKSGVTIWQPVGWGESSYGYVSTDINGITYSFGPKGMAILPSKDYLEKHSFRDGMKVLLNLRKV